MCGGYDGEEYLSECIRFDFSLGAWLPDSSMDRARFEADSVYFQEDGGSLLIAGGRESKVEDVLIIKYISVWSRNHYFWFIAGVLPWRRRALPRRLLVPRARPPASHPSQPPLPPPLGRGHPPTHRRIRGHGRGHHAGRHLLVRPQQSRVDSAGNCHFLPKFRHNKTQKK